MKHFYLLLATLFALFVQSFGLHSYKCYTSPVYKDCNVCLCENQRVSYCSQKVCAEAEREDCNDGDQMMNSEGLFCTCHNQNLYCEEEAFGFHWRKYIWN